RAERCSGSSARTAPRSTPPRNWRVSAARWGRTAPSTRADGRPSTARTRAAGSTARPAATPPASRAPGSLVVDPALDEEKLGDGRGGQDHEEDHSERRRIAGVPELEADVVDVIEEEGAGVVGAALGHHHDVV